MKEIPLTQGKVALVDDEDYDELVKYRWGICYKDNCIYARRNAPKGYRPTIILMHRQIMQAREGEEIDHYDSNGLNNVRSNLRKCTHRQNLRNQRLASNNTSGFKGVYWDKRLQRWRARIFLSPDRSGLPPKHNNRTLWLGCFTDKAEAAVAYNAAVLKYYGDFARLNDVSQGQPQKHDEPAAVIH